MMQMLVHIHQIHWEPQIIFQDNTIKRAIIMSNLTSFNMSNSTIVNQTLLVEGINPIIINLDNIEVENTQSVVLNSETTMNIKNSIFNDYLANGFDFELLPSDEIVFENSIFDEFALYIRCANVSTIITTTRNDVGSQVYFDENYAFLYDTQGYNWMAHITFINGELKRNINTNNGRLIQLFNMNTNTLSTSTI